MIPYLKYISSLNSWPIAIIILTLLLRMKVLLLITAITDKISKPGKFSLTKDGLSIEEYIETKQKETLEIISNLPKQDKLSNRNKGIEEVHGNQKDIIKEDNDPLKKSWAGVQGPVSNKRQLSAEVKEIPGSIFYKLKLTVQSTDPTDPLTGYVKFYLHPTFVNSEPIVPVVNGMATLHLISYGSFTFGVETDNGQRKVKMDLATDVVGVSQKFKES